MRICSGPGCMGICAEYMRYCPECAKDKPEGAKLTGAARARDDEYEPLYQGSRWRKGVRPRVLQRYPFCVDCGALSTVADHNIPARIIVPICQAERLFLDPMGGFYILSNLRGRCHTCHNKKTRTEDTQDWSDELTKVLTPYRTVSIVVTTPDVA